MTDARVLLWGSEIGAVSWLEDRQIGVFQYSGAFAKSGIEVAPLTMPLRDAPYEFPNLNQQTFKGLPGLLADSLPDKFGNALIDAWLARENRTAASFNPVDRLCYTGSRGMGALEFQPSRGSVSNTSRTVQIEALVELANQALDTRRTLNGRFDGIDDQSAIEDILRVGTSAGGARAKAILAWNEKTSEFRSGQIPNDPEFGYWIMKFDGIDGNRDKEIADPQGFGRIEYAYFLMARQAGIEMTPCRLHEEGGRAHFMTKRFDRTTSGEKIHMQSLCALQHFDFNMAGAYSYEQAIQTLKLLSIPMPSIEEQYRRALFNVITRNQDDHVKNIAFLMDRAGTWRLAPAFDIAYSYNPDGAWTSQHQMSLNGKRDDFTPEDFLAFAKMAGIKITKIKRILAEIAAAVSAWPKHAKIAGVPSGDASRLQNTFRTQLISLE